MLGLAAAHGFALSVLTQSSVRAKLAAGDFERLRRTALRAHPRPVPTRPLNELPRPARRSRRPSRLKRRTRTKRPASPASQAVGRAAAAAAAAARLSQEKEEPEAAPAVSPEEELPPPPPPTSMPPPLPAVSQSPVQEAPDSPTSVQAASPTAAAAEVDDSVKFHSSAPPRRACLAPLKDAHALKCALLACAPDAHAAAGVRDARLSALRDARGGEAAARSRKKKKRKRPGATTRSRRPASSSTRAIGLRRGGVSRDVEDDDNDEANGPRRAPGPCILRGSPPALRRGLSGRAAPQMGLARRPQERPGDRASSRRGSPNQAARRGSGADPSLDSVRPAPVVLPAYMPVLWRHGVAVASDASGATTIADSPLQDLRLGEAAVGLAVPDDLFVDRASMFPLSPQATAPLPAARRRRTSSAVPAQSTRSAGATCSPGSS